MITKSDLQAFKEDVLKENEALLQELENEKTSNQKKVEEFRNNLEKEATDKFNLKKANIAGRLSAIDALIAKAPPEEQCQSSPNELV